MSLAARTALYFNYCVAARFRLSPVPTSAKEVSFLADSFRKLAPVEYFSIQTPKEQSQVPYKQYLSVVLSPFDQLSQLDPFNGINQDIVQTSAQLLHRQSELQSYLRTICGLPRFSYVENDQFYFGGQTRVVFKHTLKPEGRHLEGQYQVSDSTAEIPFFTLSGSDPAQVLPMMRHNFQKIHKMELLSIELGTAGLRAIGLNSQLGNVHVDADTVVDVDAIMDLGKTVPMKYESRAKQRFGKLGGHRR